MTNTRKNHAAGVTDEQGVNTLDKEVRKEVSFRYAPHLKKQTNKDSAGWITFQL